MSFEESQHPRTGTGQFAVKPAAESQVELTPPPYSPEDWHAMQADPTHTSPAIEAREEYVEAVTRDVAGHLSGVVCWDEGGGPTIFYGSHTDGPDAPGDLAFIVDDSGRWQFQTENGEVVETSDLTAESDPAQVASWIEEQAKKHGSLPHQQG